MRHKIVDGGIAVDNWLLAQASLEQNHNHKLDDLLREIDEYYCDVLVAPWT